MGGYYIRTPEHRELQRKLHLKKTIKKRYCLECGKELSNHGDSPRCRKCYITPEFREKQKRNSGMLGKHHSPEIRKKIRDSVLGTKRTPEQRKNISRARMGISHKHTPTSRLKISIAQRGKLGNNWKGGISKTNYNLRFVIQHSFEYRQWRSDVFHRDNFTCRKCGDSRGSNLQAHHIKSFQDIINDHKITNIEQALKCEELWNLNNGVTLCETCHKKTRRRIKSSEQQVLL